MSVAVKQKEAEKLLRDYRHMVGISISLYDHMYNPVCGVNEDGGSFCQAVRRSDEINERCLACDIKAFHKVKQSGNRYIYKCHMGLYDIIIPIIDENHIIGYVMIGQVLSDEPLEHLWANVAKKCENLDLNMEELKSQFEKLRRFSTEQVESAVSIAQACAAYILLREIIKIERSSLFVRIEDYVKKHLKEPLEAQTLSKALNAGRTTIYNCVKENTSLPLMAYIKRTRLRKAKELLRNTEMKISQIAEEVGIGDYNYFSRIFRARYDITPSQFRKRK